MRIVNEPFPGLFVIEGFRHTDARGVFVKAFHAVQFRRMNINFEPREEFFSSSRRNVVRGMHFQLPPHDGEKLVYCSQGKFLDVLIDLRAGSPTYRQVTTVELNAERPLLIFQPRGIAHGFLAREEGSVMTYLTSAVHHPPADGGVRWDSIGFAWPCTDPLVSARDLALPHLEEFDTPFSFERTPAPTKPGRALITGASGFVGSRLVRRLVKDGWETASLLRPTSKTGELGPEGERLRFIRAEGGFDALAAIMDEFRPTHVFHTAACTFHDYQPAQVHQFVNTNIGFGTVVVEAMLAKGVRHLVNTGTSWQHYEGAPYSPVNLYAATKQAFEDLLQYYVEARGLQVVTLKLFDTYGTGDPRPKLLNLLANARASQRQLPLSPGEQLLDLVWVEDVVRAYVQAAGMFGSGPGFHRSYGLSSRDRMTLRRFVDLYRETTGEAVPVLLGARPYRMREVMVPWTGQSLPGWTPTPDALRLFLSGHSPTTPALLAD